MNENNRPAQLPWWFYAFIVAFFATCLLGIASASRAQEVTTCWKTSSQWHEKATDGTVFKVRHQYSVPCP